MLWSTISDLISVISDLEMTLKVIIVFRSDTPLSEISARPAKLHLITLTDLSKLRAQRICCISAGTLVYSTSFERVFCGVCGCSCVFHRFVPEINLHSFIMAILSVCLSVRPSVTD